MQALNQKMYDRQLKRIKELDETKSINKILYPQGLLTQLVVGLGGGYLIFLLFKNIGFSSEWIAVIFIFLYIIVSIRYTRIIKSLLKK